ncbi:hydrolase [Wenjunlia vitaminophila]|uniref:Hydrolase n=1 Tax=Wenjunlia vitaminophila TaxID=76728 RepID=A0A0T6LMJ1_WENVI|nr:alpha/beta family hydrolase [Wenjunlia vitaminophila]KRV47129.1 hydrolase [Wenjunlia vitaminophila]
MTALDPPRLVPTPAGDARITSAPASDARAVLALGHGAGGGVESRDLRALAAALPAHGVTVALVEQPWRVAGRKLAPAPKTLDAGWTAVWGALRAQGLPVVAGGRSAGARVACRTARELGAVAVLALAFPLHPPGRPERSRAGELAAAGLPTLVVQGGNDPFGRPEEFVAEFPGEFSERPSPGPGPGAGGAAGGVAERELLAVPHADHAFAVPKRAPLDEAAALRVVTDGVADWLERVLRGV